MPASVCGCWGRLLVGRAGPGVGRVRWELRLRAAERGVFKAVEMRRLLAAEGLRVSAGKMSALWSGTPVSVRLDDVEVLCRVLGCDAAGLLVLDPPPDGSAARPAGASGDTSPIVPAPAPPSPLEGAGPGEGARRSVRPSLPPV
ncbi:helix-turn-helix domain-containing protein [Streptomyces sp. NPDC008141]|uniref:helix-turn-helix domain-containing protein n=1 Tax=Streptomyces sp. NPDC008141 TaxID=3364815 RepID=UPI0036EC9FFC